MDLSAKKIIVLCFLFAVSCFLFFLWQGIYLPKERGATEKIFSVKEGQGVKEITFNLKKEGLIKNQFFFIFYTIISGKVRNLQAGEYLLSPADSIAKIAQKIASGDIAKIKVTIPEGFTIKQIEEELNTKLTRSVLVNFKTGDFRDEFSFFEDVPNSASLEGFLFPDTYQFSYRTNIEEIVKKMLDNFNKKLTPDLRKEISRQGKTIFEIITMASLIEKEVKTFEDKKLVSGILWKRLENGIPLQVDATITYITGKKITKISIEETKIDSPYNTYKYQGLPPGPICNPGLESIKAALYPKDSEYFYYLSTSEGKTIFSKTLEAHNLAKARYLK